MEKKTRIKYNETPPEKFARIRRQAEERIKQWPDMASNANADLHVVIYELKIHLAELEIQNEELKLAMKEMAAWQEKNEEMYDFGALKEKTGKFNRDFHGVRARPNAQKEEKLIPHDNSRK
jgi:hypothetical protein